MKLPRLKTSHPITIGDNALSIGEVPGAAYKIDSPPQWFYPLLQLLDGRNDSENIHKKLSQSNFKIPKEQITQTIDSLVSLGCLEDIHEEVNTLSSSEKELYSRQLTLFSLREKQGKPGSFYQDKIKSQTVVIFGVGGWGSWISLNLTLAGFGRIILIDRDHVELSNLNRQVLFKTNDIGKLKVAAAKESLEQHNPYIEIETISDYVRMDSAQVESIIKDASLIFISWTNLSYFFENSVEKIIHEIAFKKSIPVIEVSADPLEITVGPIFVNDKASPCFHCIKEKVRDQFYAHEPSIRILQETRLKEWMLSHKQGQASSWQTAPALSIMAGLVADQAIKFVSRYEEPSLVGKRLKLNVETFTQETENFFKDPNCAQCK